MASTWCIQKSSIVNLLLEWTHQMSTPLEHNDDNLCANSKEEITNKDIVIPIHENLQNFTVVEPFIEQAIAIQEGVSLEANAHRQMVALENGIFQFSANSTCAVQEISPCTEQQQQNLDVIADCYEVSNAAIGNKINVLQKLRFNAAMQQEKQCNLQNDIAPFGLKHLYALGWQYCYLALLLRRNLTPIAIFFESNLLTYEYPAGRLQTAYLRIDTMETKSMLYRQELCAQQCQALATLGLAFNQSTRVLNISQMQQRESSHSTKDARSTPKKRTKRIRERQLQAAEIFTWRPSSRTEATSSPVIEDAIVKGVHNKIGDKGAIAIFRALRTNVWLLSLSIIAVNLTDISMPSLAAALRLNSTLTSLDLSYNYITSVGAKCLCEALEEAPDSNLIQLNLSHNFLTDDATDLICNMLEENETLIKLDISWNKIGPASVLGVLEILQQNFVFMELNVSGEDIFNTCISLNDSNVPNTASLIVKSRSKPHKTISKCDYKVNNLPYNISNSIVTALKKLNPAFSAINLTSSTAKLPIDKVKGSRWVMLSGFMLQELDSLVIAGLLPNNTHILTLNLSNNEHLGHNGVIPILEAIAHCPTLRTILLYNVGLFPISAPAVADCVVTNCTIQEVMLHDGSVLKVQEIRGNVPAKFTSIYDISIPKVNIFDYWVYVKGLELNHHVQKLNSLELPGSHGVGDSNTPELSYSLNGRSLQTFETVFISNKLLHHFYLEALCLKGCNIDSHGGTVLANIVANHKSLQILELENNNLGAEGGDAMGECIEVNTSLHYLNLSWNSLTSTGVMSFTKGLARNTTLQKLDLRGNNIEAAGIVALANGIEKNTSLKELYLRWNRICSIGAVSLASALCFNKTLTVLDIDQHNMSCKGGEAFAQMFSQNQIITTVHMNGAAPEISQDDESQHSYSRCGLGADAACSLAKSLMEHKSITRLDLAQNTMELRGLREIAGVFKQNSSLVVIDLSYSNIDSCVAEDLFTNLKYNFTLRVLDIAHNYISNEGMTACVSMLNFNKTIQELNVAQNGITEEPFGVLATCLTARLPQAGELTQDSMNDESKKINKEYALRWLCISGNVILDTTKSALLELAPLIVVECE